MVTTSDVTVRDAKRLGFPIIAVAVVGMVIAVIRLTGPFAYGYDYDVYRVAGSAIIHEESLFGPWMGQHMAHPLPFTYPPLAAAVAVPFALTPVQDELGFGQVGIMLMAMCFYDCALEKTPWPRGTLIGVAAAIKLLPASSSRTCG